MIFNKTFLSDFSMIFSFKNNPNTDPITNPKPFAITSKNLHPKGMEGF
jgi:hypothetical protein